MALKDANRNRYLIKTYGITIQQYNAQLQAQNGVCAICLRPPKRGNLHVDHNHRNGVLRGLLCYPCNKFRVGRNDSRHADLFRRLAEYLEKGAWNESKDH